MARFRTVIRPVTSTARPLVRNSHIVPRFYLNKFADTSKFVFLYVPGRDPQRRSTKSVSSEEDYFEYTVNSEATANRYENWFQRFETDAAAVYPTIHAGQPLTGEHEIVWSSFVATSFLRSRKVREQFGPALTRMMDAENYDSEEQIREMQCELLRQGIFVDSEDMRAKVRQTLEEMRAPAFGQLAGIEDSAKMITKNILEKERWFILEAAPGCEFVTSDCPVQTWALNGPQAPITMGSGFGHQNTAIVFPLSPRMLFFAGNGVRWSSKVLSLEDTVRVNTATVQFAHRAVYSLGRSAEIQALVDRELNKYTFGENCFIPKKPQAGCPRSRFRDLGKHEPQPTSVILGPSAVTMCSEPGHWLVSCGSSRAGWRQTTARVILNRLSISQSSAHWRLKGETYEQRKCAAPAP